MHNSSRLFNMSEGMMGHIPKTSRMSTGIRWPYMKETYIVMSPLITTEKVTLRIRARITGGASRARVGEGRVKGEA